MKTYSINKLCSYVLIIWLKLLCNVDANNVWGPGLSPDKIVMPARYFFIDLSEGSQNNTAFVADTSKLTVKIKGDSLSGSCRLWLDILNRKDNSFIIRYRLYESCHNLRISTMYDNHHIGSSPYIFKDNILHDSCDHPESNYDIWSNAYDCPNQIEQIRSDLSPFKNVNMSLVFSKMLEKYDRPGSISLCYYAIKNNKLFRKCFGQHVGFHMFSDAILLSVLRKVKLPDVSFFINLGDWPLIKDTSDPLPLFSWCGSDDTLDIVLPTYDITESTLENMGRVMLDMLSVQGNIDKKWEDKIGQGFWRGRDSCRERLNLVDISRQHPHLYNVSLTNFFFFRNQEKKYGPKVPHISFFKFFDFKYQINVDGTVAAYRFPYLLVGDSVVLKQQSQYYEHFYKQLMPGVHYIPVKRDLSDLTEKLQWAINNDAEAQKISKNGREFAREHLMPKNIFCYYALALKEWSKRLIGDVYIVDGMEQVLQENDQICPKFKKNKSREEL